MNQFNPIKLNVIGLKFIEYDLFFLYAYDFNINACIQHATISLMSFTSTKKVTLRHDGDWSGKCWELEGDFTEFISAVEEGRNYASLITVPIIKVENGVISMVYRFPSELFTISSQEDIDSLMTELKKYQQK